MIGELQTPLANPDFPKLLEDVTNFDLLTFINKKTSILFKLLKFSKKVTDLTTQTTFYGFCDAE